MSSMRILASIAVVLGLILVPVAFAQPTPGQNAPVFKARDVKDQEVDIATTAAKDPGLLILFFFSVDGGQDLAAKLKKVDGKYGNVVAVEMKEDPQAVMRFAEQFGIPYHVIVENATINTQGLYGPFATLPITFFVSADKKVLQVVQGAGKGKDVYLTKVAEAHLKRMPAKSAEVAQMAIEAGEDVKTATSTLGHAKVAEGKLDEATAVFTGVDDKAGLAKVALEKGESAKAVELAQQAPAEDGYARTVQGEALVQMNKPEEAKAAFGQAVSLPAEEWQLSEAYNGKGRVSQFTGALDEALADYDKAVSLDGFNVTALGNSGAALQEKGDLDGAAAMLDQAGARGLNDQLVTMMLDQIRQDLKAKQDTERRELIRKQIADLSERFKKQQEAGTAVPVDPWTSPPLKVAFLPSGAAPIMLERAGMDVVLRRAIANSVNDAKRIGVVEREMIDALLQELNLGSSELSDPNTQLRLGKVFAARYLGFIDFVSAPGGAPTLALRMVDTETTSIATQIMREVSPKGDLAAMAADVASEITKSIQSDRPLQGLIAQVDGASVIINLGEGHEVQAGDVFDILLDGPVVEVGGRKLQGKPRKVGSLQIVSVDGDMSACEVVAGSLKEGVQLAPEMKVREAVKAAPDQKA